MITAMLVAAALTPPANWKLVWNDEFAKSGAPDPKKWTYEKGYIRNNEKQFYTADRRENARVEGGRLIIEARKDNFEGKEVTSASLTTQGIAEWSSGRFEVRAKVPAMRGTWPAIWLLGANIPTIGWPKCGEIDIMEHVGFDVGRIHANIHTEAYNHMNGKGRGANVVEPLVTSKFHVYALEWTADKIDIFIDDKKYFTYTKESDDVAVWPFNKPHYLILNLAIGGAWGGQQGIDDSAFPTRFEVDYVRVFQPK